MKRPEMILCHVCGVMATYRAETRTSWLYKCPHGHTNAIPRPAEDVPRETPPREPDR